MWVPLLKYRREAFKEFERFKGLLEVEMGQKVITFKIDRGEFNSIEFFDFFQSTLNQTETHNTIFSFQQLM